MLLEFLAVMMISIFFVATKNKGQFYSLITELQRPSNGIPLNKHFPLDLTKEVELEVVKPDGTKEKRRIYSFCALIFLSTWGWTTNTAARNYIDYLS